MDIQSTSQVVNSVVASNGQAGAAESRVKAANAQTEQAPKPVEDSEKAEPAKDEGQRGGVDIKV